MEKSPIDRQIEEIDYVIGQLYIEVMRQSGIIRLMDWLAEKLRALMLSEIAKMIVEQREKMQEIIDSWYTGIQYSDKEGKGNDE